MSTLLGTSWILAVVLGIRFTQTITLGSIIIGVLLGAAGLVVFGYGARWKAAYQVSEATVQSLEEGRAAYLLRSERLQDELQAHLLELGECKAQLAEANARPSQETVVQMIESMDAHGVERTMKAVQAIEQSMANHERRAQERYERQTERAQERHELQMGVMVELATTIRELRQGGSSG